MPTTSTRKRAMPSASKTVVLAVGYLSTAMAFLGTPTLRFSSTSRTTPHPVPTTTPATTRAKTVLWDQIHDGFITSTGGHHHLPNIWHEDGEEVSFQVKKKGEVFLVGAGPGDPDLLTVGAVKALERPALVIADRLISKEILSLVKGELRIARKLPGCAEEAQQEIYQWVREAVEEGRDVVRLKIGDPFLFGRGGEEILEYRKYGVEPKVIPGVSSAFAAPLLSSISVTHRGVSNQVYICTGFGRDGERPYLAPYFPTQTTIFLMAVGRLAELSKSLQEVGYPSTTPVAIVEKASTPQQRTLVGTLATIVDVAAKHEAKPPAVVVVGEVVGVLREDKLAAIVEENTPKKNEKADGVVA